jgi:NAD(P)-dependent dehydrogenase (short-subunit alcohol dehydrogenase family)
MPEGTDYGLWTKQVPMLNTGNDANLGDPSAVAAVVAMAASDDGAFLTGTEIRIDGGAHC